MRTTHLPRPILLVLIFLLAVTFLAGIMLGFSSVHVRAAAVTASPGLSATLPVGTPMLPASGTPAPTPTATPLTPASPPSADTTGILILGILLVAVIMVGLIWGGRLRRR